MEQKSCNNWDQFFVFAFLFLFLFLFFCFCFVFFFFDIIQNYYFLYIKLCVFYHYS